MAGFTASPANGTSFTLNGDSPHADTKSGSANTAFDVSTDIQLIGLGTWAVSALPAGLAAAITCTITAAQSFLTITTWTDYGSASWMATPGGNSIDSPVPEMPGKFYAGGGFTPNGGTVSLTSILGTTFSGSASMPPIESAGAGFIAMGPGGALVGTYIIDVVVTSVTPSQGFSSGGTAVTIIGSGFFNLGSISVKFGTTSATNVVVVDDTHITCVSPAHAGGDVNVTVTYSSDIGSGTKVNGFKYTVATIDSAFPSSSGVFGDAHISIHGAGFVDAGTLTAVYFDGVAATDVHVFDDTYLTCHNPAHVAGYISISMLFNGTDMYTSASPIFLYEQYTWTLVTPTNPVHGGTTPPSPTQGSTITITSVGSILGGIDPTQIQTISLIYTDPSGVVQIINVPSTYWIIITFFLFTFCLPDLGPDEPPIIDIVITSTQFSGSVDLGKLITIFFKNASGIYRLVTGKTNDTLYDVTNGGTIDVKIPNPFIKTGFI